MPIRRSFAFWTRDTKTKFPVGGEDASEPPAGQDQGFHQVILHYPTLSLESDQLIKNMRITINNEPVSEFLQYSEIVNQFLMYAYHSPNILLISVL